MTNAEDPLAQALLAQLVQTHSEPMFISSTESRVLYGNPSARKLLGIADDADITVYSNVDFYSSEELARLKREVPNVPGQRNWQGTIYFRHFITGETIPCDTHIVPMFHPFSGEWIGRSAVVHDLRPVIRAREALVASENSFRSIFEQAPISIALYRGRNMVLERANDRLLAMWGRDTSVIGKSFPEIFPELNNQQFMDMLQQVYDTGETIEVTAIPVTWNRNGESRDDFFDLTYTAVKNANGEVNGVMAIGNDVTPNILNQNEIDASHRRFRNIVEQAPMGIGLLSGKEMIISEGNDLIFKFWGKGRSITGKRLIDALPELKGQPFIGLLENVFDTGIPFFGNDTLVRLEHQGKLMDTYFDFVYTPLRDSAGQITGVMILCNEVSARVTAHREQEESERRFRLIVEQAPTPMCLFQGNSLVIELANEAMLQTWGRTRSVIGRELESALPEMADQPFPSMLRKVLKTGKSISGKEVLAQHLRDDVLVDSYYDFSYNPVKQSDGTITGVMVISHDVTEQVLARQQKDAFVGIVSHELKTPVTSLKAYTQMLGRIFRREGNERTADMLGKMDRQINKLSKIIGDLLDVTRISSGKLQFTRTSFDFDELVNEVVEDLQHTTDSHLIELRREAPVMVLADRERIGQVITNLLGNAIKYSPGSARIVVSTGLTMEGEVSLCVQDEGIGIPKDKQDRVFEQFFRVNNNMDFNNSGLGLGLYISSEIIQREKGRIWMESDGAGLGSAFCFMLPIARNASV